MEVVVMEGSEVAFVHAVATIGALHQEIGAEFTAATGFEISQGRELLYLLNDLIFNERASVGPFRLDADLLAFRMESPATAGRIAIGMSIPAAKLLRNSCSAAVERVDPVDFATLVGGTSDEIRAFVRDLDAVLIPNPGRCHPGEKASSRVGDREAPP
jgi:hypothetical protein